MERFLAELSRAAEERRAGRLRKLQKKIRKDLVKESFTSFCVQRDILNRVSCNV